MERQPDSRQERLSKYTSFMIDLLDSRHEIERSLHMKDGDGLREDITCAGFRAENFEPPELLDDYITRHSPITIDIAAHVQRDGQVYFDHMQLYPEDRAPLSIERDEYFTTVRQGGETVAMLIDDGSIETTLRQLLPQNVRSVATANQILRYVNEYSPALTNTAELAIEAPDLTGSVAFSRVETIDDSIETLSIINQLQHPSQSDVYVRLALSESINRRRIEANTNHTSRNLTIDVRRPETSSKTTDWSVEELMSTELYPNSPIDIDVATRQHIDRLSQVLASLPKSERL